MKKRFKIERIPGVLASAYEKATRMVIESYYGPVADELVAEFKAGLLLDLGTGPGYLPIEIARRAPEVEIVGVDLSPKLIFMARENAARAGLTDRLSFEIGNSARLHFADESFDMVLSTGMLHSLKDPVAVFREIFRVLKKGGQAWIYDPSNVTDYIDRRQWKAALDLRERFFLWLFRLLGLQKPITAYRREEVLPMVTAAGFGGMHIDQRDNEIRIKLRK